MLKLYFTQLINNQKIKIQHGDRKITEKYTLTQGSISDVCNVVSFVKVVNYQKGTFWIVSTTQTLIHHTNLTASERFFMEILNES